MTVLLLTGTPHTFSLVNDQVALGYQGRINAVHFTTVTFSIHTVWHLYDLDNQERVPHQGYALLPRGSNAKTYRR